MSHLSVQKTTFSSHAVGAHVAGAYGLAPPVRCRLSNATQNDLYLVEAAGRAYVYRVWAQAAASVARLEAVLELQYELAARGLPVVAPVRHPAGAFVKTLSAPEGERAAALFVFALGEPPGRGISPPQSFAVGRLAAALHLGADVLPKIPNVPVQDARSLLLEPLATISNCGAATATQAEAFERAVETLARRIGGLETSPPLFGLCHGDIHGLNVLFDDDTPTLLDFERLSYGWRAYDLAVFVWWIRGVPKESEVKEAFLEGYRSEHPLAEQIIENIPVFVPVRHLLLTADIVTYAAQGVDVGRWVDEAFVEKRLESIQRWLENLS